MEETENYAKMPENQTYFGFGKSKRFIDFDSVLLFLNKNDLMAILFLARSTALKSEPLLITASAL